MDSVGVRIQNFEFQDQALVLARLAESRVGGLFAPANVEALFDEFALPRPAKVSNLLQALEKQGYVARAKVRKGTAGWRLSPSGRKRSGELASDMDLAALTAEAGVHPLGELAETPHPVIPPSLSPPELIKPLHDFLSEHPFETNVFGMTRFPDPTDKLDPIAPAIGAARDACRAHGLEFHLASDRKIMDDLWPNVAAHLWGSQHAVAFYENRTGKGLNYNLNIEVGSCLVLGRRLAVLKDEPVEKLPTDLVGRIYCEVDLADPSTVSSELHRWARDDLKLGSCPNCP